MVIITLLEIDQKMNRKDFEEKLAQAGITVKNADDCLRNDVQAFVVVPADKKLACVYCGKPCDAVQTHDVREAYYDLVTCNYPMCKRLKAEGASVPSDPKPISRGNQRQEYQRQYQREHYQRTKAAKGKG